LDELDQLPKEGFIEKDAEIAKLDAETLKIKAPCARIWLLQGAIT
jgi:hypothetical protein